jgi:hypothetical protein
MTIHQIWTVFKKYRPLLPLFFLAGYCLDAVITALKGSVNLNGDTIDYALTLKHYVAFGSILLNLFIYVTFRPLYKFSFALTILLGLLNVLTFSALEKSYSFFYKNLKISFQPPAFFAGLLAYFLHFTMVNESLIRFFTPKLTQKEKGEKLEARYAEDVLKFKEKYSGYPVEKWNEIVNQNGYLPAAKEAAKQLLLDHLKAKA